MASLSRANERLLRSLIAKHEFQPIADAIVEQAVECYVLVRGKREDYSKLGNSRYGGLPDLPESISWPRSTRGHLTFLMQIDLQELPAIAGNPLPTRGMLYFFIEDDESCTDVVAQMLFFDGRRSHLRKATAPSNDELAHQYYRNLVPHKATIATGIDVPSYGSQLFRLAERSTGTNHDGECSDRFFKLIEEALWNGKRKAQECVGQLLGRSPELTEDARENAHLTSTGKRDRIYDYEYRKKNRTKLQSGASEWQFMWQIRSDSKVGVCIWDSGDFDIFIRAADLAKRDFTKAYVEIDTG